VRIDHIFITPDITVTEVEVISDGLTRKASDHLPLMAAIHLRDCSQKEP
jgi:endonuclease/exonuclease/phosphatase family metal-dependent hydrolase